MNDIIILINIKESFNDQEIQECAISLHSIYGRWSISHKNVFLFLHDQRIFIQYMFTILIIPIDDNIISEIEKFLIIMIEDIHEI